MKSGVYNVYEDPNQEDDLCSFLCFVVGVIAMFIVVGAVATVIVLGLDDRHSITSLTSSHLAKPLSPRVLESITDPSAMYVQVIDDTNADTSTKLDLLLLVHSLPDKSSVRDMIRKTWMKESSPKVEVLFVMPAHDATPNELEIARKESKAHRDMVIFLASPVVPESEALMMELVWSMRSRKFAYLMKTRDSMYIRIDALMKDVIKDLLKTSSNAYLGYFEGQQNPKDRMSTKLFEPEWHLCDKFIRFAHSGGYILSRKLVDRLHSQVSVLYPFNNEDVALGTWLSPYDDVNWTHSIQFDTEIGKSRGCRNNLIVFPCTDMVSQHDRLLGDGAVCLKEHETIQTYRYNFNTFPSKCCSPVKF